MSLCFLLFILRYKTNVNNDLIISNFFYLELSLYFECDKNRVYSYILSGLSPFSEWESYFSCYRKAFKIKVDY